MRCGRTWTLAGTHCCPVLYPVVLHPLEVDPWPPKRLKGKRDLDLAVEGFIR
jgi:hypothetical protein